MAENKSTRPGTLFKVVSAWKDAIEKKREEPYRDVLKGLAESSSIHGIPKIVSTPQLAIKMLWILLFIATVTIYIFQLITLFTTFFDYPVQTSVKLRFSTLPFPAITICNMNAVKHSKINSSDALQNLIYKTNTSSRKKRQAVRPIPRDSETAYWAYVQKQLLSGNDSDGNKRPTRETEHGDRWKRSTSDNTTSNETDIFGDAYWDDWYDYYSNNLSNSYYDESYENSEYYTGGSDDWTSGESAYYYVHTALNSPQDAEYEFSYLFQYIYRKMPRIERTNISHQGQDFIQHVTYMGRVIEDLVLETSFNVDVDGSFYVIPLNGWLSAAAVTVFDISVLKTSFNVDVDGSFYVIPLHGWLPNVEVTNTADYGNCHTIADKRLMSWRSGPRHGISITLNLELDDYIYDVTPGLGARVVVHEPGTVPLPFENGMTLSPITETNIGLRLDEINRLGEPHGDCVDGDEFRRSYGKKYSISACESFCRIQHTVEACKCLPIEAPDGFKFNTSVIPICDPANATHNRCALKVDIKFNSGQYQCGCAGPCSETQYSMILSSRYWPDNGHLSKLVGDMCKKTNKTLSVCNGTADEIKEYRQNFLKLRIFFEDLNYQSITEEPLYEPIRFVSDIGGTTGLFLGASVLSLVEVLQLALETVLFLRRKCRSRTSNSKVDDRRRK